MKKKSDNFFEPSASLLKRAQAVINGYSLVVEPDGEGEFLGYALELPGVVAGGETPEACVADLHFALETVVASYFSDGVAPPVAGGRQKRVEQVNVRFTKAERLLLERESARQGFRGIGDLIRTEMLRAIRATA